MRAVQPAPVSETRISAPQGELVGRAPKRRHAGVQAIVHEPHLPLAFGELDPGRGVGDPPFLGRRSEPRHRRAQPEGGLPAIPALAARVSECGQLLDRSRGIEAIEHGHQRMLGGQPVARHPGEERHLDPAHGPPQRTGNPGRPAQGERTPLRFPSPGPAGPVHLPGNRPAARMGSRGREQAHPFEADPARIGLPRRDEGEVQGGRINLRPRDTEREPEAGLARDPAKVGPHRRAGLEHSGKEPDPFHGDLVAGEPEVELPVFVHRVAHRAVERQGRYPGADEQLAAVRETVLGGVGSPP